MIITSRSGGVIALGLLENEWTLSDFTARFLEICKRSFARKNRRTLSRVTVSTCKYGPLTLEQALREAFKDNEPLFGGRRLNSQLTKDLKVVIPVVSEFGKTIAFTNYRRHRVPKRKCASTSFSVYFTNVNYLLQFRTKFSAQKMPRRTSKFGKCKFFHPTAVYEFETENLLAQGQLWQTHPFSNLSNMVDLGNYIQITSPGIGTLSVRSPLRNASRKHFGITRHAISQMYWFLLDQASPIGNPQSQ